MNKTEYNKYVKQQIKDLPLEKQLRIIQKENNNIEKTKDWLNEIRSQLLKSYTYCNKCGKYSKTSDFKTSSEKEVRQETTYTDCGYGEDDTWGNVEYIIDYEICPSCNNKKQVRKHYLRTLNEFDRQGNKVK